MESCADVKADVPGGAKEGRGESMSAHDELVALLSDDFAAQLRDNPEFASQAGFHQYDSALQDLAPRCWDARREQNDSVRAELETLLSRDELQGADRLHAELLANAIEIESRGIELGCHLAPLNGVGGGGAVFENFIELLDYMQFETEEDFQRYLGRLIAFSGQMDGFINLLAYGAMQGKSAWKASIPIVTKRLDDLIASDLDMLRAPLTGKDVKQEVRDEIDKGIEHCFRTPLQKLRDFLNGFYAGRAREVAGCTALKDGSEIYSLCLQYHIGTTKTPEEVHALGLQEVARIEERIQKDVLDVLSFPGTFEEFTTGLKADKSHSYETEEDLLDGYRAVMSEIDQQLVPRFFATAPKLPLEIVPSRAGSGAYYIAGTADGSRPARLHVNVSNLAAQPKYGVTALILHEGAPGHHLQWSASLQNEALPDFLRFLEDRRYEYMPARRPLYNGFLEGWALYCEHLGEEMGLYKTPHDLFGRLSVEMMHAVRLVVDTGIHAFGWTVERASAYMLEKTGMAETKCDFECHRYASWPGQACAYKLGELEMKDLRSRAERALGAKFSLPAFHNVCIDAGPMPLNVLAKRVDAWIANQA